MDRRTLISAVGAATLLANAPAAFADDATLEDMHPAKYKSLEELAGHCVLTANDCLRHCFGMAAMNDTSMAACTASVYEVVAACGALQSLAAINSPHLPAFARVVGDICSACQQQCEKFPKVASCHACGQSCKACAEECRKLAA